MLREWTYTASSRDALGNTSPSALEISLGRGFCNPRPSRFPSGFALGKSLGPRGAKSPPLGNLSGLGGCISQYIPPLGSVRIQYLFLAKIYQATKTLGNGLYTLEILMSDRQLSNLSAYFHGKFNFYDTFWVGLPISAVSVSEGTD